MTEETKKQKLGKDECYVVNKAGRVSMVKKNMVPKGCKVCDATGKVKSED